ncbi:helix-turn-helix transcriptional regulator [Kineosporia succinea]|uniref:Transcriptional regulator YheO n=1 Tax=Kineosporia succinea TaxID=84632 RepID=A0ABT9PAK2_9ACTN|nr:transcriptional regulator [Kineosporia succinea]MDP9829532.1 putative transcriptional regulator YheO [Kineosporia succinea]
MSIDEHGQTPRTRHLPPRATVDGERLIAVFAGLVEPLGRALPTSSEVVLHDLSKLPDSIVAVHGDVTGRSIGDPATDLLLERISEGDHEHQLGYETHLPDGRRMQSSTMIIRDVSGHPVAALCINTDISAWLEVRRIADAMIASPALAALAATTPDLPDPADLPERAPRPDSPESFPRDIDELAAHLLRAATDEAGVPVPRMKKEHKLRFVETLQSKGFFMLRDAVEMAATALGVTRFTIYNYLNEIDSRAGAPSGSSPHETSETSP